MGGAKSQVIKSHEAAHALLEVLFMSGLIWGLPVLFPLFQSSIDFARCQVTPCESSLQVIELLYTIASCIYALGMFVIGLVMPKISYVQLFLQVGNFLFIMAIIFVYLSYIRGNIILYGIGLVLLGVVTPMVYQTMLLKLQGTNNTILITLCSFFNSLSSLFPVIYSYLNNFASVLVYLALCAALMAWNIKYSKTRRAVKENQDEESQQEETKGMTNKYLQILTQNWLVTLAPFCVVQLFISTCFSATMYSQLLDKGIDDPATSNAYMLSYYITLACGALLSPLVGFCISRLGTWVGFLINAVCGIIGYFVTEFSLIPVGFAFLAISISPFYASLYTQIGQRAKPSEVHVIMGFSALLLGLGSLVATVVVSFSAEPNFYRILNCISGSLEFIALITLVPLSQLVK